MGCFGCGGSSCFVFFVFCFFFFNDTATTEIYTLSLHDALPIREEAQDDGHDNIVTDLDKILTAARHLLRSEEHTSELQSHSDLVCRLLLEKKKKTSRNTKINTNNTD